MSLHHCNGESCKAGRSEADLCWCGCSPCHAMWTGGTITNGYAKVLCPTPCIDCCCSEHHWVGYGAPDDANGNGDDLESSAMKCKHCQAELDFREECVICKKQLIDHDLDTLACDPEDETPMPPTFRYEGQPDRVCNEIHPWDRRQDSLSVEIERKLGPMCNPGCPSDCDLH